MSYTSLLLCRQVICKICMTKDTIFCDFYENATLSRKCWHFGEIFRIHKSSPIVDEISLFIRETGEVKKRFLSNPTSCFLAASLLALLVSASAGCAAFAAAFVAGTNFAVVSPLAAATAAFSLPARRSVLNHLQKYRYFWTILESFFYFFLLNLFL